MEKQPYIMLLKFWAVMVCVGWIAIVGYREIYAREMVVGNVFGATAPVGSDCRGTFQQRYECRANAMINKDNALFYNWGKRLALTFLPPLTVLYLLSKFLRRRQEEEARRQRQDLARRRRAGLPQGASA